MQETNCWDFKNCERGPGGKAIVELGICAAATTTGQDGFNRGTNGGRVCWAVTGTLCGGEVQGTFAQKETSCMACDFFKLVRTEEGPHFRLLTLGHHTA